MLLNHATEMCYIGQAKDLNGRIKEHRNVGYNVRKGGGQPETVMTEFRLIGHRAQNNPNASRSKTTKS